MLNDGFDVQEMTRLIRHRRSVKPVDMDPGRVVEPGLLMELLENANHAPTHGLTEPWRFTIFQGDARAELAGVMQRIYRETTPVNEFREDKMLKMGQNPLLAGAVISIGMARQAGGKIPEIEEIEAVACAVQNMHLTASAAGLGAYWSSPPLVETREFVEWLGLRTGDRCLGLFYVGWPKPGFVWPKGLRKPVEEKLIWRGELRSS
ncbi:nitroreductase family protein [Phragmitibacter flavus]|nr:nitroreductase [Phragmitibacter flavus]